jgi:hypothetical protein
MTDAQVFITKSESSCRNESDCVNLIPVRKSDGLQTAPANDNPMVKHEHDDYRKGSRSVLVDSFDKAPDSLEKKASLTGCEPDADFLSTSQESTDGASKNTVSSSDENQVTSKSRKKKDRSKLRKGKWSVRIVQYR